MISPQGSSSLFGGERGWNEEDWTASDDRVRGGKSKSYLTANGNYALFHGNLDIETLGGAGFASQRTIAEQRHWDLSAFCGIELLCDVRESDHKRYTFILKDELPPNEPDATREKSTVSWEFDFQLEPEQLTNGSHLVAVEIPWAKLRSTYRGREVQNPRPLRLEQVRRFSVMMRSFFGSQSGDFTLRINEIRCMDKQESYCKLSLDDTSSCDSSNKKGGETIDGRNVLGCDRNSWWCWLARCVKR